MSPNDGVSANVHMEPNKHQPRHSRHAPRGKQMSSSILADQIAPSYMSLDAGVSANEYSSVRMEPK